MFLYKCIIAYLWKNACHRMVVFLFLQHQLLFSLQQEVSKWGAGAGLSLSFHSLIKVLCFNYCVLDFMQICFFKYTLTRPSSWRNTWFKRYTWMRGTWARFILASSCFWAYLSWEARVSSSTNGIMNTGKYGCLKQFCRFQLLLPNSVFITTRTSKFKRRPTIEF